VEGFKVVNDHHGHGAGDALDVVLNRPTTP